MVLTFSVEAFFVTNGCSPFESRTRNRCGLRNSLRPFIGTFSEGGYFTEIGAMISQKVTLIQAGIFGSARDLEEPSSGLSFFWYSKDEACAVRNRLAAAPELGDAVPGTGGFRKVRSLLRCKV
ncbi:MAG: hypothetical protein AUH13_06985 [Acidobacteria bacterium 13_2_20CM_58_27]|nr:MAG: hypothetical protein AUH13_06985 [Acidobacteria bacterium 13_2_20CM_58_27]